MVEMGRARNPAVRCLIKLLPFMISRIAFDIRFKLMVSIFSGHKA